MDMNKAMKLLLSETRLKSTLIKPLEQLANDGFEVRDGCYLFRNLLKSTNATRSSFEDCTGYEAFVNSLHVEDYDSTAPVTQAILFVIAVFHNWNSRKEYPTLVAILSADEFSVVVKFHVRRTGERWLSDNIEGYEDPVMSVDSSENLPVLLQMP